MPLYVHDGLARSLLSAEERGRLLFRLASRFEIGMTRELEAEAEISTLREARGSDASQPGQTDGTHSATTASER
jgi:hypothetical protein